MTKHKFPSGVFYNADCFDVLAKLPAECADMVLADLPYGTTNCAWDSVLPFETLWREYNRIAKPNAAIVLTASQPFTSALVASNFKLFRHEWIYKKRVASNFGQAKQAPMKEHESVLVFARKSPRYFPIKEPRVGSGGSRVKYAFTEASYNTPGAFVSDTLRLGVGAAKRDKLRYPSSVREFNNRAAGDRGLHPTQKPVALFEYLIRTYTRQGDTVLDNTAGSGTTAIAAINALRRFICIERDSDYFAAAVGRIKNHFDFG